VQAVHVRDANVVRLGVLHDDIIPPALVQRGHDGIDGIDERHLVSRARKQLSHQASADVPSPELHDVFHVHLSLKNE
jgi:hypothetical protein